MVPVYVLIVTFMIGAGTEEFTYGCADRACVEDILSHAHESPNLARIRVVKAEAGVVARTNLSGILPWQPLSDEWFQ